MLWKSMIQRCHNPRNPCFHRYGGRGILVCDRWRQSFAAFVQDIGPRPDGATLDRIDNDRGYEPGNVRWATRREQSENRFDTRLITHEGRTQTITAWAREVGLSAPTLWSRINAGWPVREALTDPIDSRFTRREQGSRRTQRVPENNNGGGVGYAVPGGCCK